MGTVHPGERNPNWKGGRVVASNGYVLIRVGVGHRLADVRGYAYEHRLVAEQKIGRPLRRGEHVHHIDGNKQNNAPENLEVLQSDEHRAKHRNRNSTRRLPGEENPLVTCACGCGERFPRYDDSGRPRSWVSGHNPSRRPNGDAILQLLAESDRPLKVCEIITRTMIPKRAVIAAVAKLRARGAVRRVQHGTYEMMQDLPREG